MSTCHSCRNGSTLIGKNGLCVACTRQAILDERQHVALLLEKHIARLEKDKKGRKTLDQFQAAQPSTAPQRRYRRRPRERP